MDMFVLPALLVLLSAACRNFIVYKGGTMSILGEIGLGLPVDLTFVALSVAISTNSLTAVWADDRGYIIVGLMILAVFPLGAIYKPCKGYIDEAKHVKSFALWVLNSILTLSAFAFLVIKVVE